MTCVTFGCMTPPLGTAMFAVCGILKCPVESYTKEALPLFLAIIGLVVFMTFFPEIVLYIPNSLFGAE